MNDKWKSLIELVVNEEEDKAKELFHEIAVDESRKIYENLIDEEDLADIDEASKEEEAVEEATDEKVEEAEKTEESKSEEAVEEATDEVEETLAGDQTADMIDDIKADEVGITAEDDDDGEEPEADADAMSDEMGVDGEEGKMDDDDAERMEDELMDLQTAIDDLRSEFEQMTGKEDEAPAEEPAPEMEPEMEATEEVAVEGEKAVDEAEAVEEDKVEEDKTEEVVEYTQKAPAPVTSSEASASPVAKAQPGGIKTANKEEASKSAPKAKVSDAGNKNKPGAKQALSPAPKAKA